MTLGPGDVAHLAKLARISLTPEEAAVLARDADAILAGFAAIESALAGGGAGSVEAPSLAPREDGVEPAPVAEREGIVRAFPEREGDLARVPRSLP